VIKFEEYIISENVYSAVSIAASIVNFILRVMDWHKFDSEDSITGTQRYVSYVVPWTSLHEFIAHRKTSPPNLPKSASLKPRAVSPLP
jgi:hypothetical protein